MLVARGVPTGKCLRSKRKFRARNTGDNETMHDPHDDLKLALRTVKRLLETAETEEAAPDEAKRLLFENVERLVFEVEKLIGSPAL